MEPHILAFDLGTGGNKAALYRADGTCTASAFVPYETHYPRAGRHEQKPEDWWQAVVRSTRELLGKTEVDTRTIRACVLSGHSLGAVPLDAEGRLLREATPIWSDSRASDQAQDFFRRVPEDRWYETTGNGFPPPLYTAFKLMWYRDEEPELYERLAHVIGTKDYINYRLTGEILTDHSYASGSGVYDLSRWQYSEELIEATGLPPAVFPDCVASTDAIGRLTRPAAEALGLHPEVRVIAGGVDNSCMALGARNTRPGRVYNSIGSSSWIAVCSSDPLIDLEARPFVFAHVVPGLFTSACSIFAAGSSFRWIRDVLCADLKERAVRSGRDVYELMTEAAQESPPGANKLLFNPSLAGGTSLDASPNVRGAFAGLDLGHTRSDMLRAAMEGIALGLRVALDALRGMTELEDEMLVVGGGSASAFWRQIFADVYGLSVVKSPVDQDAAALGAAALAAVGAGMWDGFDFIDRLHARTDEHAPDPARAALYERLLPAYRRLAEQQSELGDMLAGLDLEKSGG